MSTSKASPFLRYKTRHRGVSYRRRKDGSKTFYVYHDGQYYSISTSEKDALALQAELRGKSARGEKTVAPSKKLFSEVAESWFESKHRLRPTTRATYRATLDRILIPRFGSRAIASFDVEDVIALIRDLEGQGLRPTSVFAYVQPL